MYLVGNYQDSVLLVLQFVSVPAFLNWHESCDRVWHFYFDKLNSDRGFFSLCSVNEVGIDAVEDKIKDAVLQQSFKSLNIQEPFQNRQYKTKRLSPIAPGLSQFEPFCHTP